MVWNGVDPRFAPAPAPGWFHRWAAERGIRRPYFLFVGYQEPNKNLPGLLRGLARLRRLEGSIPDLVLVGGAGPHGAEVRALAEDLGLTACVRWLGQIGMEELVAVYNQALALVLPSHYEGFGLPVVEAMACGTPVVASDRGAMAEVGGGATLACDVRDPERLAEALGRIASDPGLRARLRAAGLRRARLFSWERCARETLAVYREVLA